MDRLAFALAVAAVAFFLGDPGMRLLAHLGNLKFEEIVAAVSLLSIPWPAS